LPDDVGDRFAQVLTVIHDQQQGAVSKIRDNLIELAATGVVARIERPGDSSDDANRIGDRREIDERRTVIGDDARPSSGLRHRLR
jgi:hypothetical protein